MKILKSLHDFLGNLDLRDFYKYIGIALGIILLFASFIVYRFYSNVGSYKKQIHQINEEREEIQKLLERADLIKKKKEKVNALLENEPNFKIAGYFKDLLAQLKLTNKLVKGQEKEFNVTEEPGEQDYDESILVAQFTDMNMKELSELLNEIEQNKRVYSKELEIQKSNNKKSPSLKVQLTIATLQHRAKSEFVE